MLILEDTRQQENKHKKKHEYFRSVGVYWNRTALYCGDYTLPSNQSVCVDTKKDIAELIGDIQVKKMPKKEIHKTVFDICEMQGISFDLAEQIYHAICDDDEKRFAEKELDLTCFQNHIAERTTSDFQALYVKRHGFFHRGLKRAQNSSIQLYILVDNIDGVTCIDDLFRWHNPRLDIWINSREIIGFWKNGRPRYKKVKKYPYAATGEWLAKSCLTMQQKYGVKFLFCKPEESGPKILELLGVM
ncbi:hypothetical protein [Enterocloster lavalensis]|uniref:hypothetical protein n=1 Tax=Enterocloster lavalensis TaxID=460384 RepID=UPI0034A16852